VRPKTKHIDIKYLHIQECHEKDLKVQFVESKNQLADFLNKPLPPIKFEKMLLAIGMILSLISGKVGAAPWKSKDEGIIHNYYLDHLNPCHDLWKIEHKPERDDTISLAIESEKRLKYFKAQAEKDCNEIFRNHWKGAISILKQCPASRHERGIVDELVSFSARTITNLVKSLIVDDSVPNDQRAVRFFSDYDPNVLIDGASSRYLGLVSNAASAHPTELQEEARGASKLHWNIVNTM